MGLFFLANWQQTIIWGRRVGVTACSSPSAVYNSVVFGYFIAGVIYGLFAWVCEQFGDDDWDDGWDDDVV